MTIALFFKCIYICTWVLFVANDKSEFRQNLAMTLKVSNQIHMLSINHRITNQRSLKHTIRVISTKNFILLVMLVLVPVIFIGTELDPTLTLYYYPLQVLFNITLIITLFVMLCTQTIVIVTCKMLKP